MIEEKIKHLEFIQNVITRKNSNSFLLKGWAITLVSASFALAAKDANITYILITFISVPVFYGLDAYYLSQERCYRNLYKDAIDPTKQVPLYSMNATSYNKDKNTWFCCLGSPSIWLIYAAIMVISALIMYAFKHYH